jgi:hypothetical protein
MMMGVQKLGQVSMNICMYLRLYLSTKEKVVISLKNSPTLMNFDHELIQTNDIYFD